MEAAPVHEETDGPLHVGATGFLRAIAQSDVFKICMRKRTAVMGQSIEPFMKLCKDWLFANYPSERFLGELWVADVESSLLPPRTATDDMVSQIRQDILDMMAGAVDECTKVGDQARGSSGIRGGGGRAVGGRRGRGRC